MLVLTRADVEELLSMEDAIAAVEDGFRYLSQGEVVMPQRAAVPVDLHNGLHLSMPALVGHDPGTLSIKVVTVYGDNPANFGLPMIQGVLLLHDARSGRPLAMMDAEHLTAMRTGAASGVATKHLARREASILTLFGVGAQAGAQLRAVFAVRPIEQVFVISRSGERDVEFCLRMETALSLPVIPCRDVRMAVESADIICTATNAVTPIFNGNWVKEGTHINAVGAYTARMRKLDTVLLKSARVFVDHHPAAQVEAGDLLIPIEEGELRYDQVVGELGELLTGKVAGRVHETDITVFKSVGLALQDAMTAGRLYERAVEAGVGQQIEL